MSCDRGVLVRTLRERARRVFARDIGGTARGHGSRRQRAAVVGVQPDWWISSGAVRDHAVLQRRRRRGRRGVARRAACGHRERRNAVPERDRGVRGGASRPEVAISAAPKAAAAREVTIAAPQAAAPRSVHGSVHSSVQRSVARGVPRSAWRAAANPGSSATHTSDAIWVFARLACGRRFCRGQRPDLQGPACCASETACGRPG